MVSEQFVDKRYTTVTNKHCHTSSICRVDQKRWTIAFDRPTSITTVSNNNNNNNNNQLSNYYSVIRL